MAVGAPAGHDDIHVWMVKVEVCRVQIRSQTLTHVDPQHDLYPSHAGGPTRGVRTNQGVHTGNICVNSREFT